MSKLILGLAGEMGSGKGAVTKYITEKYGAGSYRFSQIFRDILDRLHVEQTRESITSISFALRQIFGQDVLAKTMYHDTLEDARDIIVIDGIRRAEDMKYLREIPHFKFLYLEANLETRYGRIICRGENNTEMKKSFEEFKESHEYDTEKTIPPLKKDADFVIENNGTYEELYEKIDAIIGQFKNIKK